MEEAPAGTVTVDGTLATVRFEDTAMGRPPVGAGELMVSVPVEEFPPATEVGDKLRAVNVGALTLSVADAVVPPSVAEMVTAVFDATGMVLIGKVADVAPATTVTLEGAVAAELLEDRLTCNPPVGAAPFRVTVPVDETPPVTVDGDTLTLEGVTGLIVSVAFADSSPWLAETVDAVMVTEVAWVTAVVDTVNVAVVAPAATVTGPVTVAEVLFEAS